MEAIYTMREGERVAYLMKPAPCDACGEIMRRRAYVFTTWSSRDEVEIRSLCDRCLEQRPAMLPRQRQSNITVRIIEFVPCGATPFFFQPPELVDGRVSSFEAAWNPRKVDPSAMAKTRDLTRLAGRPGATFSDDAAPVRIGADVHAQLEAKDRALGIAEGIAYLEDLSKAAPVIGSEEKKRLSDQRGAP